MSRPRQNFHQDSEAGLNRQINMELYASYVYQSMASTLELNNNYVLIHIILIH